MNIVTTAIISQVDLIKVVVLSLVPMLAWGMTAQSTLLVVKEATDLESLTPLMWSAIACFSLIGWAVNDLDKVAELWRPGENKYELWKERLKLLKGVVASFAAGVFTFFIGKILPGPLFAVLGLKPESGKIPEIPEMLLFILVAGGAYMGTRWFSALERKFTGRAKDEGAQM